MRAVMNLSKPNTIKSTGDARGSVLLHVLFLYLLCVCVFSSEMTSGWEIALVFAALLVVGLAVAVAAYCYRRR